MSDVLTRFGRSTGLDHTMVVYGFTQILEEGSVVDGGRAAAGIPDHDSWWCPVVCLNVPLDFASVPLLLSDATRLFRQYMGQITGHKCVIKAHISGLNVMCNRVAPK